MASPNITAQQLQQLYDYWKEANALANEPLFEGVCYKCGCLLWNPNHCNTIAKDNDSEQAPILCLYSRIPDFLPYEKVARDGSTKWLCCNVCKKRQRLPPEYGRPITGNPNFDTARRDLPHVIAQLDSPAQKRAIALASLMSTTKTQRNDHHHCWRSIQGMYGIQPKTSRHYYGMYGAIASATQIDPNTQQGLNAKVCAALTWLKANNPLYEGFYANYETMFRYHYSAREAFVSVRPSPDELDLIMTRQLQDEQNALIYPADDLFDVPPITGRDDIVGIQHPTRSLDARNHNVRSYYAGISGENDIRQQCAAV